MATVNTVKIAAPWSRRAVPVDDGDRQPVVRAALGEGHAEHHDADEEQPHVGPDARLRSSRTVQGSRGVSVCGSSPSSSRTGTNRTATIAATAIRAAMTREVHGHGESDRRRAHGERRARHRAEAEEGVHERHHGLAELAFGFCALDVHHDVDRPVAEAEQGEADHDERNRRRDRSADPDEHETDCDGDEHAGHAESRAEAGHQPWGRHEAEDRGDRAREDDQADALGAEVDIVADRGEPGHPAREAQPRQEEDREDRVARREKFSARARSAGCHVVLGYRLGSMSVAVVREVLQYGRNAVLQRTAVAVTAPYSNRSTPTSPERYRAGTGHATDCAEPVSRMPPPRRRAPDAATAARGRRWAERRRGRRTRARSTRDPHSRRGR